MKLTRTDIIAAAIGGLAAALCDTQHWSAFVAAMAVGTVYVVSSTLRGEETSK